MNNKYLWFLVVGFFILLLFGSWILFGGCSATVSLEEQATTTTAASLSSSSSTQTGGTTTTTLGQSGGISGTVSWNWSGSPSQSGTLYVFLWTNDDFSDKDLLAFNGLAQAAQKFTLSSGQTSADFNFAAPDGPMKGTTPTPGQYYLMALLYVGRDAALFADPVSGDKLGQFSDGLMPKGLGGTSNPTAIISSSTPMINNNFSLNATWTTTPTTTTSTTTVPPGLWQDIGGVTKGGSAGNAAVYALVSDSSGNLYAGGIFDSAGGVPVNNIAKWNHSTSSWESLAGGLDGYVSALALDPVSGNLYAGGGFNSATNGGGSITVNKIAKWNGSSWSALGSGFSGGGDQILTLAVDAKNEDIYAAGNFSNAGGIPANNIAGWKTASSTWDAMAGGLSLNLGGSIYSCQVFNLVFGSDGNLYVAGTFNTTEAVPANNVVKWNTTLHAWEALGNGVNGPGAWVLAADSFGNIYLGGSGVGGDPVIRKWDGSSWGSFLASDGNAPLSAMAVNSPSEVYVDRYNFSTLISNIIKWNGLSWNNLTGDIIDSGGSLQIKALALDPSGNLYIGGRFTSAGGTPAANIVKHINP